MVTAVLDYEAVRKQVSSIFAWNAIEGARSALAQLSDALSGRPKYQWMITQDRAPHESGNRVFQHGPHGARKRHIAELIQSGQRFRLVGANGAQKLSGFIMGKYRGPEPLLDYGKRFGCAAIEYERGREWVRVAELKPETRTQAAPPKSSGQAPAINPRARSSGAPGLTGIDRAAAGFLASHT